MTPEELERLRTVLASLNVPGAAPRDALANRLLTTPLPPMTITAQAPDFLRAQTDASRVIPPMPRDYANRLPADRARMRQERIAETTSPEVRDMLMSATADSLFRLTGLPGYLGSELPPDLAGVYVHPPKLRPTPAEEWFEEEPRRAGYLGIRRPNRLTLAHEAGHKFYSDALRTPTAEDKAEAFRKAFDFLSRTGTPADTAGWEKELKWRDAGDIGITQAVGDILRHPSRVFSGHPLGARFGTPNDPLYEMFSPTPNRQ